MGHVLQVLITTAQINQNTNLVLWYAYAVSAIAVNGHEKFFPRYPPTRTSETISADEDQNLKLEDPKSQDKTEDTRAGEHNRNIAAFRWISTHLEEELRDLIDSKLTGRCAGIRVPSAQQYWSAIVEHFQPRLQKDLHECRGQLQNFQADGKSNAAKHVTRYMTLLECIGAENTTEYRESFIATIPINILSHIAELPNYENLTNRELCSAFLKRAEVQLQDNPVPASAPDNVRALDTMQHAVNLASGTHPSPAPAPVPIPLPTNYYPPLPDYYYVQQHPHRQQHRQQPHFAQQFEGHAFAAQQQYNHNPHYSSPHHQLQ